MVDYERFRSLIKLDVPAAPIDDARDGQYRLEMQARLDPENSSVDKGLLTVGLPATSLWSGLGEYGRDLIHPGTIGYGPANLDGDVIAGPYVALRGRFDLDGVRKAFGELRPLSGARPAYVP
jgi:hypothetical protein